MRAWSALTDGRYREVIEAAQAGQDAAPGQSVAVQLLGQEAKAWARLGNHRPVTRALEKGRVLLDSLPNSERPDNHFVVDPDKFDFYAMDCYRLVGDDKVGSRPSLLMLGTELDNALRQLYPKEPRANDSGRRWSRPQPDETHLLQHGLDERGVAAGPRRCPGGNEIARALVDRIQAALPSGRIDLAAKFSNCTLLARP